MWKSLKFTPAKNGFMAGIFHENKSTNGKHFSGSAVVEVNDGNGEKQVAGQEALDEEVIEADKTLKENHSLFRNETHLEDFVDPANIERSSSEASDDSSLVNQSSNQNLPHVELISNQNTDECKMAESEQTTANQNPDSLLPDLIQNS